MYFLIDYENVGNNGMRGADVLLPEDSIFIFYSAAAINMEAQHLEAIRSSGCTFEVCKLVKTRKNGLDFYIASRLGEIVGAGNRGNMAIISRDVGFQAVREYWQCRAKPNRRIILGESIERCIITASETNERTRIVRERLRNTNIDSFYASYEESQRLKKLLAQLFADTEFAPRTDEMEDIIKKGTSPKVIYLDTLHRFGRKDGLEVYRRLKSCPEL